MDEKTLLIVAQTGHKPRSCKCGVVSANVTEADKVGHVGIKKMCATALS